MSIKIPGSVEEYHYLGHGYNARTNKIIKVQLFKQKPDPNYYIICGKYSVPTAQVNRHSPTN